ncbi:MAG: AraC family transcriptional regulator [Eubacterium sp.]|nr:AraC family transcriptional regulator [Eubacterium sp.]
MDFRHELVLPNEDLPFRLFVFEGKDGNYKVSKHWHRSIEIFLVLEGGIDFYINSQLYRLAPGQFMLVNSNEVHSIDCPDPNFTLVLQIPRGLFENYLFDADSLLFQRSCQKDAVLVSLIRRMQEAYVQRQTGYLFQILRDFYELMYLLVSDYRILEVDEERRKQNKNLDRLSKITSYIQVNYRENLTLEGVAHIFGFSPAYLSKMFQKYAGINYKAYLLDLRTEAGYRLLMNTELAVGQIAMECGFPDSRSFAKAFRQRYGMTPAEYRKNA